MSVMRSYSWMPVREVTPMYRKMPKSTARGMRRSTSVITMDIPGGQEGVKGEAVKCFETLQTSHAQQFATVERIINSAREQPS